MISCAILFTIHAKFYSQKFKPKGIFYFGLIFRAHIRLKENTIEKEEGYFSVVDIVAILTNSADPKQYIKKMRSRDFELNSKWGTICTPVKMKAADGKMRNIQAATIDGIFRIIQSIPSPKAEPFKMWLAEVGKELMRLLIQNLPLIERWKHMRKKVIQKNGLTKDYRQYKFAKN